MNNTIAKDIKDNQISVFVIPNKDYTTILEEILLSVSYIYKKICYVTLNKPYITLQNKFKEKGIDVSKLVFIDSVSGKVGKNNQVLFVSSPKALTELSIIITKILNTDIEVVFFDSLSTLLVYDKPSVAIKFIHFIISKMRSSNKSCIFTALEEDMKTELMKDLSMFVDRIVRMG